MSGDWNNDNDMKNGVENFINNIHNFSAPTSATLRTSSNVILRRGYTLMLLPKWGNMRKYENHVICNYFMSDNICAKSDSIVMIAK